MIINHPLLGPRDSAEFVYKGDASLIQRPDWQAEGALQAFTEYGYLRDNPAGLHRELWFRKTQSQIWRTLRVLRELLV